MRINLSVFSFTQLLEWLDAKITQSRERVDMNNRFDYSLRENRKRNAALRQRRVEAQRRYMRKKIIYIMNKL